MKDRHILLLANSLKHSLSDLQGVELLQESGKYVFFLEILNKMNFIMIKGVSLNKYDINIEENLLLDKVNGQINIPQRVGPFQTWASMDYPFFPSISRFNKDHNIVSGLEKMQFHYCSEITIDSSASIYVTPLLYTSIRAFP